MWIRVVAGIAALLVACHTHEPAPIAPTADSPAVQGTALPEEPPAPAPARVERFDVPRDTAGSVVRSGSLAPGIVFLPGVCSNAYAYLLSFPETARAHGGVVAIDGDQACGAPDSGFRSFSWDPARQNARLEAAFAAAGFAPMPDGLTLIGYSAGADIGELMVRRWPSRYTRVVLIGAPSDPKPQLVATARAVVTMSCSRDVPGRMREGARRIAAAGVPATYFEMPGCTHGNVADAERVFGAALDWLTENSRP